MTAAFDDIEVTAPLAGARSNHTVWARAYGDKDLESFLKAIQSQTILWRTFKKLLSDLYRDRHITEYDFSNPAFTEQLIYSEGYKKALQDILRLIPQTTEK